MVRRSIRRLRRTGTIDASLRVILRVAAGRIGKGELETGEVRRRVLDRLRVSATDRVGADGVRADRVVRTPGGRREAGEVGGGTRRENRASTDHAVLRADLHLAEATRPVDEGFVDLVAGVLAFEL